MINFFRKLKRAISWGIFMFSNEWWDLAFLQEMMKKKLIEMEKGYRLHGSGLHAFSYARIIRLALKYLEMGNEDYWYERDWKNHHKLQHKYYMKFWDVMKKHICYFWD